jgi:hypothetical protein
MMGQGMLAMDRNLFLMVRIAYLEKRVVGEVCVQLAATEATTPKTPNKGRILGMVVYEEGR